MSPDGGGADRVDAVIGYHDRTKHRLHRYARSPGYLDWANQPDPFRRYAGAAKYLLPFSDDDPTPPYAELFSQVIPASELNVASLGLFLEQSLGVSATKRHGDSSWKLRCNPSSGNLHPTEGYVVLGGMAGLRDDAGVYHYAPDDHALELRGELHGTAWGALAAGFPPGVFLCGLTSIYWREAWKYGERALRYCHHDVGHALGALRLSAASLGWRCVMLDALSDAELGKFLGLNRLESEGDSEREHADLLLAVLTQSGPGEVANALPGGAIEGALRTAWHGVPNRLSEEHVEWDVIAATAEACEKPRIVSAIHRLGGSPHTNDEISHPTATMQAGQVFRQRRSAVAMDGTTWISREAFFRMMRSTLHEPDAPPFDAWPYAPRIDLALFVHRVEGVTPGVYVLVRDSRRVDLLRHAMRADFAWSRPAACPETLPLYLLGEVDCRTMAAHLSCLQSIAGDGAFSLGMIAEFEAPLREHGAWYYPRLFWEAGLIGQILYLEAEAAGVRATGIGCYFDDAVHDALGLHGHAFQSLYHFTVGGPVDDPRITGLPPYSAERRSMRGWV